MNRLTSKATCAKANEQGGGCDEDYGGHSPMASIRSIDNVAETFGISRCLLRLCEWRGLIKRRRQVGGVWVYSWADCDRIAFIIKGRRAGLRLSELQAIVKAMENDSARVHEAGQELCMALAQRLERQRKMIDDALAELGHAHTALGQKLAGGA